MPSSAEVSAAIPAYALYGEANADVLADVHVETIRARSSTLDWRIGTHRHPALFQAIWIASGHARMTIEDQTFDLAAESFAFLPPLTVHGFAFAPDTGGIVVSVRTPALRAALGNEPAALGRLGRPIVLPAVTAGRRDAVGEARSLFEALLRDHGENRFGRGTALAARAALLGVWFARLGGEPDDRQGDRNDVEIVRRFLAEVEATFATSRRLGDYARASGVSSSHLGRLCRTVAGRSPLSVVHDRRLVEAKRLLVHTAEPVARIADRLGFANAAHFSRFFRARTELSPRGFRVSTAARATND